MTAVLRKIVIKSVESQTVVIVSGKDMMNCGIISFGRRK